jgi:hypothetical protein
LATLRLFDKASTLATIMDPPKDVTRLLPSSEPRWKFESEVEVANVSSLGS